MWISLVDGASDAAPKYANISRELQSKEPPDTHTLVLALMAWRMSNGI